MKTHPDRTTGRKSLKQVGTYNANPIEITFFDLVCEDFETHGGDWFSEGFWTLFWHRFGNWRMGVQPRPIRAPLSLIYKIAFRLSKWMTGIELPYTVKVGRRVRLDHFGGMILIAESIGDGTVIRQNTTFGIAKPSSPDARPVIGNGVDIGVGVAILGNVSVGDNSIIGANAVVLSDVPVGATFVGVPARLVEKSSYPLPSLIARRSD